jgi:hypothetical protein
VEEDIGAWAHGAVELETRSWLHRYRSKTERKQSRKAARVGDGSASLCWHARARANSSAGQRWRAREAKSLCRGEEEGGGEPTGDSCRSRRAGVWREAAVGKPNMTRGNRATGGLQREPTLGHERRMRTGSLGRGVGEARTVWSCGAGGAALLARRSLPARCERQGHGLDRIGRKRAWGWLQEC